MRSSIARVCAHADAAPRTHRLAELLAAEEGMAGPVPEDGGGREEVGALHRRHVCNDSLSDTLIAATCTSIAATSVMAVYHESVW